MSLHYVHQYRVRAYESDATGALAPHQLCNYLQDISELHARALGLSTGQLPRHLTWMLTGLRWNVSKWPVWRDVLTLETWPSGVDRLYAYRDFRGLDTDGNEWFTGSSRWIMLDIDRKRPSRITDEVRDLPLPQTENNLPDFQRIDPKGETISTRKFTVRRSDIDLLQHTNNAVYASWIEESIPDSMLTSHQISDFAIQFRSESIAGDVIEIETVNQDSGKFGHLIRKRGDQAILASAETKWSQR